MPASIAIEDPFCRRHRYCQCSSTDSAIWRPSLRVRGLSSSPPTSHPSISEKVEPREQPAFDTGDNRNTHNSISNSQEGDAPVAIKKNRTLLGEMILQHRELSNTHTLRRQPSSSTESTEAGSDLRLPSLVPSSSSRSSNSRRVDGTFESLAVRTESAPEPSLFDVFQLAPLVISPSTGLVLAKERHPNAYPAEAVQQYWEILQPVLESQKFQKKHTSQPISDEQAGPVVEWLSSDSPSLAYELPTFQKALKEGIEPCLQRDKERKFAAEVFVQRNKFFAHLGFTERQRKIASGGMFQVSNMCAKNGKGLPLTVIWEKVKESGMTDKLLLHNLMYVSATFFTGSVKSRRKRRSRYGHLVGIASILDVLDLDADNQHIIDDDDDIVDLTDEIAIYHDLLYAPTEQSINIRVKLLVAQGLAKEAEQLLDEHSNGEADLRLRSYTPVLLLYLELRDLGSALRLYKTMRSMVTVHLDVETYIHLIAGFAEQKQFCVDAKPMDVASELGYQHVSGPGLFNELVEELKSENFEISESSARRLFNALSIGFPDYAPSDESFYTPVVSNDPVDNKELFVSRVCIDLSSGICPKSGIKLRLIQLKDEEKKKLINGIVSLAKTLQTRLLEKYNNNQASGVAADQNLTDFYKWLDRRQGEPFTILVDGANVGYYNQNFEDGRFSYHQLKFVVDYLEKLGENVLVVLPNKYTKDSFSVSTKVSGPVAFRHQQLTSSEMAIRNDLWHREKLVRIPVGHLGTLP